MRELALTGYTSNRTRQNCASFLAKWLGIDWRLGAEWYECMLIDYDVAYVEHGSEHGPGTAARTQAAKRITMTRLRWILAGKETGGAVSYQSSLFAPHFRHPPNRPS
ncbi:hypothetical protein FB446DRAFT_796080 [Lentinula raphanica]|nr:hypothetical protein FB446DRAFT_796080 [Lentinula raphanica]